ncbi:MAG: electron transporter RnfB [Desulfobacterales bacterium CG23_combo_of_CG06-09_8_20_14_all_52_9]|nr:MAG: electron transporter RnfB [Desulfobacterales bacterium CG23_combo_of_CG06-09_8_20_14_all_52_9]
MTEALVFMLGLGLICGSILSIASKIFYVYEDPRKTEVEGLLAGANCGGCGFAGCAAAAEAVVTGEAPPSVCIVGGAESAANVARVMGVDAGTAEPKFSSSKCDGGNRAEDSYFYMGVDSCQAVSAFFGGKRKCDVGCLGYGDCVRACLFNAIKIGPEGFPVIDEKKCVGCGACERACPKQVLSVTTIRDRLLHFNREDDCLAPCQQTCPAQIDIPLYIAQIKNGDYEGAVRTIRDRNPLLLSCGRVCPHPCENICRRGIEDEPVSINQLKRFVADREMNSGSRIPIPCAPPTGKKVAVIGGGPAGLTCAYFLKRLGHNVSIYEAMPKPGGMIRYGIPEYRLPKKVLDWEIEGILNLGIRVHTNVKMGVDFDIPSLVAADYDAIFLGIGAWKDYLLKIEGENLSGCHTGIDFLSRIASGESIPIGRKVVVVGGGNTAIDCVRTLVRLGAEEVYIVYRRTRKEMPANVVEIEAADHEGVKFIFLAAPVRVLGDDQGKVTQLEYLKMELGEPDASGRRRPVPVKGSETLLPVDMVISAIGQEPEMTFKGEGKRAQSLKTTRRNTIEVNPETLQSSIPYIFAAGDVATGPSLVVEAIGGGRLAARSIHLYLSGKTVTPPEKSLFKRHIPGTLFDSVPGIQKVPRVPMPEIPVGERIYSFVEVDQVVSEEDAKKESSRCLNCGRICYNKDVAA